MPYIAMKAWPRDKATKKKMAMLINKAILEGWGSPQASVNFSLEEFSKEEWDEAVRKPDIDNNPNMLIVDGEPTEAFKALLEEGEDPCEALGLTEKKTTSKEDYQKTISFPIGEPNDAYAQYFIGQSYLAPLSLSQVPTFNVTFEPGCRNNWHIHHASKGGGQMLICIGGRGWYQEWGKEPVAMTPGTVINIPEGVKHWHGAAKDSWFSHLAMEVPGEEAKAEWLEPVDEEQYGKLV